MALITQAQWETIIGPDEVVSLCALHAGDATADSGRVEAALEQGSDHVQEAAVGAGGLLTADGCTPKQQRWVAIAAAYFAADAKPQYRNRQEVNPWTSQMAAVNAELDAWSVRRRNSSTSTAGHAPRVGSYNTSSTRTRGW